MYSSAILALQDISEYLREQNGRLEKSGDVWIVTPHRIFNKETRRLNAELGINKVNYIGNTNGNKQK